MTREEFDERAGRFWEDFEALLTQLEADGLSLHTNECATWLEPLHWPPEKCMVSSYPGKRTYA